MRRMKYSLLFLVIIVRSCTGYVVNYRRLIDHDRPEMLPGEDQRDVAQRVFLNNLNKLNLHYTEVTLIIGKVFAGKSSLASYLTRQELTSVDDSGVFVLEDANGRIGKAHPYTSYPELYLDNVSEIAYYDIPGYLGSSDAGYETISRFFINQLISSVRMVRILLTIKYADLEKAKHAVFQLEGALSFLNIENLDKFCESIGLAVTFVVNNSPGNEIEHDTVVRERIRNFLQEAMKDVDTYVNDDTYKENIKTLIKQFIANYENIILMRKAMGAGNVYTHVTHIGAGVILNARRTENIPMFYSHKHLFSIFRYKFSSDEKDIILYADRTKIELDKLIGQMIDRIKLFYKKILKEAVDYNKTVDLFEVWIETYSKNLKNVEVRCKTDRNQCLTAIFQTIQILQVSIPKELQIKIEGYYDYLLFIEYVMNSKKFQVKTNRWLGKLKSIKNYLLVCKDYVLNLIKFYHSHSKNVYKSKNEEKTPSHKSCCGNYVLTKPSRSKVDILKSIFDKKRYPTYILESNLNQIGTSHSEHGHKIAEKANEVETLIECHDLNPGTLKLQLKGKYLSFIDAFEMISKINLTIYCNSSYPIKRIEFFALIDITIDMDIIFAFRQIIFPVDVIIIAPTWHVPNNIRIKLNGRPGENISRLDKFEDGLPGNPGGPASAFYGIGKYFDTPGNLVIESLGGDGSRGGHGEFGDNGEDGDVRTDMPNCTVKRCIYATLLHDWNGGRYPLVDENEVITAMLGPASFFMNLIMLEGLPGQPGQDGYDGGKGGYRGFGNKIDIINLSGDRVEHIYPSIMDGRPGLPGLAGMGGAGGDRECNFPVIKIILLGHFKLPGFDELCSSIWAAGGVSGESGKNENGMEKAEPARPIFQTHQAITDYKYYLINSLDSAIRNDLLELYSNLEGNPKVRELYTPLGLIKEYINLETMYLEKRFDQNYTYFYILLSERVAQFDHSKVNKDEMVINEETTKSNDTSNGTYESNSKLAVKLLSAALQIKTNYLTHYINRTYIVLDVALFLKDLKITISSYEILKTAQTRRNETLDKVSSLTHKLRILNEKLKELNVKLREYLSQIKDNIKSMMTEVRDKIKEIKKNKKKILAGGILKFFAGTTNFVVGCLFDLEPWIGFLTTMLRTTADSFINRYLPAKNTDIYPGIYYIIPKKEETMESFKNMPILTILAELQRIMFEAWESISEAARQVYEDFKKNVAKQLAVGLEPLPEDMYTYLQNELGNEIKKRKGMTVQEIIIFLEERNIVTNVTEDVLLKQLKKNRDFIITTSQELIDFLQVMKNSFWDFVMKARENFNLIVYALLNAVGGAIVTLFTALQVMFSEENVFDMVVMPIAQLLGGYFGIDAAYLEAYKKEGQAMNALIQFNGYFREKIFPAISNFAKCIHDTDFLTTSSKIVKDMDLIGTFTATSDMLNGGAQGFQVQANMSRVTSSVQQVLLGFIDINKDAEFFNVQLKELAGKDFIVEDAVADGIQDDAPLRASVDDMKLSIQKNLILIDYEAAVRTVDLLHFPFMSNFTVRYDINSSNLDTYITEVKRLIDEMEKVCDVITEKNMPQQYFKKDFNDMNTSPFFTWYLSSSSDLIAQILLGKSVALYADIQLLQNKFDAIKFKEISIAFSLNEDHSSEEKTTFEIVMKKISTCTLSMKMVGSSAYKCAGNVYLLSTDVIEFNHSFSALKEKSVYEREYLYENDAYKSLRKNRAQLSPYGTWEIMLNCDEHARESLQALQGLVNMHLIGHALYVDSAICPHTITKFINIYTSDNLV